MRFLISITVFFFAASFNLKAESKTHSKPINSSQNKTQKKSADFILIENDYVRLPPPVAKNGAAFMVISNQDKIEHKVIGISSDISESTELHTHIKEGDMMKMRKVEEMIIPALGKLVLEPGSHHIMFIGLKKPLEENQEVKLEFTFDDQSKMTKSIKVKKM